jgi:hypothetical protein
MKGSGTGKSKQQAKEEGARQALHAMGWASAASGSYYWFTSALRASYSFEEVTRIIAHQNVAGMMDIVINSIHVNQLKAVLNLMEESDVMPVRMTKERK